MRIVGLRILTVGHCACRALLTWHFSHTAVLPDPLSSQTLALWLSAAFIVLCGIAEGIVGALYATVHRGLTCGFLGETSVSSRCRGLLGLRSGALSLFCVIDGYALSVTLVRGSVSTDVP